MCQQAFMLASTMNAGVKICRHAVWEVRKAHRQAGWHAGRQGGKQAGRQAGRIKQASLQEGRHTSYCTGSALLNISLVRKTADSPTHSHGTSQDVEPSHVLPARHTPRRSQSDA